MKRMKNRDTKPLCPKTFLKLKKRKRDLLKINFETPSTIEKFNVSLNAQKRARMSGSQAKISC